MTKTAKPKQPTSARSAKTGLYITAATAKRRPATTVVEARKPPSVRAWALQRISTGRLFLASVRRSHRTVLDIRAGYADISDWLVVRVRVEVIEK